MSSSIGKGLAEVILTISLLLVLYVPSFPLSSIPLALVLFILACWLLPVMYNLCQWRVRAAAIACLPPALYSVLWVIDRDSLNQTAPWLWIAVLMTGALIGAYGYVVEKWADKLANNIIVRN